MNKRIKELAKERLVQYEYTECGMQECYKYEFDPEELQKFVDSIVQECAKVVDIWSDEVPPSEGYDKLTVGRLKEHFGVKS